MQTPTPLTPTSLKELAGISIGYASMILSGDRSPAPALAISIYRKTGHKFGPLAGMTAERIDEYERKLAELQSFQERAA